MKRIGILCADTIPPLHFLDLAGGQTAVAVVGRFGFALRRGVLGSVSGLLLILLFICVTWLVLGTHLLLTFLLGRYIDLHGLM